MELSDKEITEFRLKKIGYAFQFYNLTPLLAVFENVELSMYLLGVRKEERREGTLKLLQFIGIQHLVHRTIDTLSGGEQQRITIV
jgi:putative ABC transport system ATP-binding protein